MNKPAASNSGFEKPQLGIATENPSGLAASPSTLGSSMEALHVGAHLSLLSQQLGAIEARLQSNPSKSSFRGKGWIEFAKVLLGGWPTFGLIFMVLFYAPIRDAINAIPEKVRAADEIGLMGVSLKTTIKVEAEKVGAIQLSETLPTLSPAAIEFLLRGTGNQNSLVTYSSDDTDATLITSIYLPDEQTLTVLNELESKKLISVFVDFDAERRSVAELVQAINNVKKQYHLREVRGTSDLGSIDYSLRPPVKMKPPFFGWTQTDLGKNAVTIILKAVSAQLAPQPEKERKVR